MSSIKVYRSQISKSKNMKVDNINYYLSTLTPTLNIDNVQYQRINFILQLKLLADQKSVGSNNIGNYVDLYQDNKHYYFFITKAEWISTSAVKFDLELDTINTFANDFTFNKKTTIHRQHKDRIVRKEYPQPQPFEDNTDGDTMSALSEYLFDTFPSYLLWSADYLFVEDNNKKFKVVHYDAEGYVIESWEGKQFTFTLEDEGTYYLRSYDGTEVIWKLTLVDLRETLNNGEYYVLQAPGRYDFKDEDAPGINTFLSKKRSILSPLVIKYFRKIDMYPEGINPQLFNKDDEKYDVYDAASAKYGNDLKWFLWYQSQDNGGEIGDYDPVECYLYPSVKMDVTINEAELYPSSFTYESPTKWYFITPKQYYFDRREWENPNGNEDFNIEVYNGSTLVTTIKIRKYIKGTDGRMYGCMIYKDSSSTAKIRPFYTTKDTTAISWLGGSSMTFTRLLIKDIPTEIFEEGIVCKTFAQASSPYNIREVLSWGTVQTVNPIYDPSSYTLNPLPGQRDDSHIIKVIETPYCPTSTSENGSDLNLTEDLFTAVADDDNYKLKFKYIDKPFTNKLQCDYSPENVCYLFTGIVPTFAVYDRDDRYESKLFNSEFYQPRFIYDSFTYVVPLERLNIPKEERAKTNIDFFVTSTVNSRFMFRFSSLDYKYSEEDFPTYLIANRQNEITTYNSNYLNYIRNGYNYDVKNKEMGLIKNLVGAGAATVGGVVAGGLKGGVAGAIVGAVTGLASGTYNTIMSQVQAENSIKQKLQETSSQATSVSGCDDVDLMGIYTGGDKAFIKIFQCSDYIKKNLADLFYYYGYADNVQEAPNLNSRRFFNFIQCDAVFNEENDTPYSDYLEDIKAKYADGVTVYHKYRQGLLLPDIYDFDQKYENWETNFN